MSGILEIPTYFLDEIAKQNQEARVTPTERRVLMGTCRRSVVMREPWSHAERLAKLQMAEV